MQDTKISTTFDYVPADPLHRGYAKLFRRLDRASVRYDAGCDALKACVEAHEAVLFFLQEDPAIVVGGVARPLLQLYTALLEVSEGGQPPLFFGRKRPAHRPASTSFAVVRGQLAAALDALEREGMKPWAAAYWLSDESNRLRITGAPRRSISRPARRPGRRRSARPAPIDPDTLRDWLGDVRQGKATGVFAAAYQQVTEQFKEAEEQDRASGIKAVENAQRRCRRLLQTLSGMVSSPRPSG